MHERQVSHYPISRLISTIYENSKLRTSDFVRLLSYRNINNGVSQLDQWLTTGDGSKFFLGQLSAAFSVGTEELLSALEETATMKHAESHAQTLRDEERRETHFRPYVFLETFRSVPTQICFFAILGGAPKFISLPKSFSSLEEDDACRIVSWLVRRHYKSAQGHCTCFGPIKAYRFIRTAEENILFDTDGTLISKERSRFRVPFVTDFSFRGRKPVLQ